LLFFAQLFTKNLNSFKCSSFISIPFSGCQPTPIIHGSSQLSIPSITPSTHFAITLSPSPKFLIAFICVHNSCRSQMAEALSELIASDVYDAYSAGTEVKNQINQDAVRIIKLLHDFDMNDTQYSKLIDVIPPVDIVITMGCNVNCPTLPCKHREDWGLEDPSGKPDHEFIKTARLIEEKVINLKERILKKEFDFQK